MTRSLLLACLALCLLSLPGSTPVSAADADVQALLAEAGDLVEEGKLSAALKRYRKADRKAGGASTDALLGMGDVCFRLKKYEQAFETAVRVLRISEDPEVLAPAYEILGRSLAAQPDRLAATYVRAETALREEMEGDKEENPEALYGLAVALRGQGRKKEALELAARVLQENPGHPEIDHARVLFCDLQWEVHGAVQDGPRVSLALPEVAAASRPDGEGPGQPLDTGRRMQGLRRVRHDMPEYPAELRRRGIRGRVTLDLRVSPDGCVTQADVMESAHPELQAPALSGALRWVYRPAMSEGRPVTAWVIARMVFAP